MSIRNFVCSYLMGLALELEILQSTLSCLIYHIWSSSENVKSYSIFYSISLLSILPSVLDCKEWTPFSDKWFFLSSFFLPRI